MALTVSLIFKLMDVGQTKVIDQLDNQYQPKYQSEGQTQESYGNKPLRVSVLSYCGNRQQNARE